MKIAVLILVVTLFCLGCSKHPINDGKAPKNMILMVGDGMGQSTITTTRI